VERLVADAGARIRAGKWTGTVCEIVHTGSAVHGYSKLPIRLVDR